MDFNNLYLFRETEPYNLPIFIPVKLQHSSTYKIRIKRSLKHEKEIMLKENTDKYVIGDLSINGLIYGMQEIIHHEQQFQTDLSLCIITKCTKCGTIGNITYKSVNQIQGLPTINKKYRVCRSCLLAHLHVS